MRGLKVLWCAAVLAGVTTTGAEEKKDNVSVNVTADLFSKYVWRGQNIIDDWVLQPSITVGYRGFTGSIWGNMDLHGKVADERELTELDYSVDYSNTSPGQDVLGYSLGVIYYDLLNAHALTTGELYAGLSASVPWSPAIRAYYDFDEIDGTYVQLSIGHTIEKIREWGSDCYCGLQAGAGVGYGSRGYNEGYFGLDEGALNDLTLTAGLPICLGQWTIKPSVGYSTMIDDDIRSVTANSDNLWGGVSASYQF